MNEIKLITVYLLRRTDKPMVLTYGDDGTDIYVGSRLKTLYGRLKDHRSDSQRANSKLYNRMREVGLYTWEMVPLLSFACEMKTIFEFEKEWCKEALDTDLNSNSPIRTEQDNKQQKANCYELNKDTIQQKNANYYELKKDTIKQKNANYYELNKDTIKQQQANYTAENYEPAV